MAEKEPVEGLRDSERNSLSTGNNDSGTDDASTYELTGIPLFLVITGLGLSIFLMSLDSSIIATAIPRITSQFNSTGDIGWYGSAYSFAMCALQPIAGKLFANFEMKHMFLACFTVFELGSLLCALAVNSPMLIVGRAIAGSGAAGCFTGAFCIVAISIPLVKRPFYIGILQSTFGIATIIGPVLGGAFTEHVTWRWCFWINLPIGAVTIMTLVLFFKPPPRGSTKAPSVLARLEKLDFLGCFLFAPAIIMIFLALQWGGSEHAWKSATIVGLFIGGAGLGVVFALWQIRRGDNAMIPPRLITERTIFFSCFSEFFAMGAVYISIYYLPEWFQVIKGAPPTKSGVMYLPLALSDVLSATLTGASLKYLGYPNPYMLLGTGLMSIATGLFSTFSLGTPHQQWIPFQVLQGLGVGMTLSMPYVATQTVLKPEDIPVGTSLLQCFQFFGASVNLAIAEAIFENKLVSRLHSWGFEELEIEKILSAGSAEARSVVSPEHIPGVLDAYNYAITRTFYVATSVAAIAFLLSLGIRWRSVKPKPEAAVSDEEARSASS
ncbi:hypothetical protein PENANT_c010G03433 [Penicillium antarcticum]|uniref:Major facilitator superfamily (MFS) profile domain-containing protein n=1 Tax=Penicillium antarcticum TaxID=416450 RepID=A0A1V6Q8R5_9EURO|nr:uncharacterized protein N7508_000503 [Penicillium antarcticum]KAJ5320220.1 hypothetical protein N7508_000503 [Penicillium antarcticum]OQD85377.1 hypothetical protein PENANT_c010G03433 [Penicillium antarcticum]